MNGIEFKRCKECDVEGMFNSDDILCFDCGSELILLSLVPAQDLARITAENIALRERLEAVERLLSDAVGKLETEYARTAASTWATPEVAEKHAKALVSIYRAALKGEPK